MSRTKLLLDVAEDIRSLADSLQTLANAISEDIDRFQYCIANKGCYKYDKAADVDIYERSR